MTRSPTWPPHHSSKLKILVVLMYRSSIVPRLSSNFSSLARDEKLDESLASYRDPEQESDTITRKIKRPYHIAGKLTLVSIKLGFPLVLQIVSCFTGDNLIW